MPNISDLFPEKGKLILTGSGREFIERLGVETARQVVLAVLRGENIREQTEPLTRRRVAIATGAMVALFARGWRDIDDFTNRLSQMVLDQMNATTQSNKEVMWPAQWLIGLTGKGVQNVLRSNPEAREQYIKDFEAAVEEASRRCEADFGAVKMTLGFIESNGKVLRTLGWKDITRLTTAVGSATLTIRGSEKATYGKVFERLVLGSVLTILGFEHVEDATSPQLERAFWLSDNSDVRECDATIRLRAGKLARFDIGFIGKGNPEIMKDKLTRYANEVKLYGRKNVSQTFIVVDRMPETKKTAEAAKKAGSEIVQMSMQFWPQELAQRMKTRLGYEAEILDIPEDELSDYLAERIAPIPILDFLNMGGDDEDTDESVGLPDDE
jgi:hypothetical protein